MANYIFIDALEIKMSIGIHEHEKRNKQRVILDVTLYPKIWGGYKKDDIADTVSYEDVISNIEKISQAKHFNLIETFGEEIINQCLKKYPISQMSIKISKPDIIQNTAAVGVFIKKSA